MVQYALITTVMDPRHLTILDDWLAFAGVRPERLIVSSAKSADTRRAIEDFSAERNLDLDIAAEVDPASIEKERVNRLKRKFGIAGERLCLHVNLDTFPFRRGHEDWLASAAEAITETGALFLTGSTKKYRTDTATTFPGLLNTQRISENMLLVQPGKWLKIQEDLAGEAARYGRYFSEALIELHCERTGESGLRRVNDHDWRVFHAQVWDERADAVRAAFRKGGKAIEPFLNGYEEDDRHPWERYFMYPRPSAIRRARIEFGRIRRELAHRILPSRKAS